MKSFVPERAIIQEMVEELQISATWFCGILMDILHEELAKVVLKPCGSLRGALGL